MHAKHRLLRFSLGGHPPAGAALGILPSSGRAGIGGSSMSLVSAKHRLLRFSLGGHPPAGAALGILPSSGRAGIGGSSTSLVSAKHRILRFLLGGHPPAGAALGIMPSRDRRKLDELGGFRMSKTRAAAQAVARNHPARRILPARRRSLPPGAPRVSRMRSTRAAAVPRRPSHRTARRSPAGEPG
jgi:hypothetical protein